MNRKDTVNPLKAMHSESCGTGPQTDERQVGLRRILEAESCGVCGDDGPNPTILKGTP